MIFNAEAYHYRQSTISEGEAERFQQNKIAYEMAPEVYKLRSFLDLLEHDIKGIKKYIVAGSSKEVLTFDLQQKIRPDLLENLQFGRE